MNFCSVKVSSYRCVSLLYRHDNNNNNAADAGRMISLEELDKFGKCSTFPCLPYLTLLFCFGGVCCCTLVGQDRREVLSLKSYFLFHDG